MITLKFRNYWIIIFFLINRHKKKLFKLELVVIKKNNIKILPVDAFGKPKAFSPNEDKSIDSPSSIVLSLK